MLLAGLPSGPCKRQGLSQVCKNLLTACVSFGAGAFERSEAAAQTGCQARGVARVGPAKFIDVGRINPWQLRRKVVHTFFKSSSDHPGSSDQFAETKRPCNWRAALSGIEPDGTVGVTTGAAGAGAAGSGGTLTVEQPASKTKKALTQIRRIF
jgi:hypothetical protein